MTYLIRTEDINELLKVLEEFDERARKDGAGEQTRHVSLMLMSPVGGSRRERCDKCKRTIIPVETVGRRVS